MKKISKISILFLPLFILSMASCKKSFLDRPPLDQITFDNFYQNDADLRLATGSLYGTTWFDFNDKALNAFGDAMAGNLARANWTDYSTFAVSSGDARSNEAWRSLYKIIAYCNLNIIYINQNAGPAVTTIAKNNALGELRFLRATAYFYLVQLWGSVPIITDNRTLADQPQVNRNLVKDVYRFIIEDMTFAARNLRVV
ncbi:MAG: RagB/SusD family nutrient uptake outer membrane protein, partial [Sphingobacteriaceae bacterium]